MYKRFIRPALFLLDPESAHNLAVFSLKAASHMPFASKILRNIFGSFRMEREIMGLKFKNPLGLAAGFDKNAEVYHILQYLGFGFIETGTVTLRPQPGNPRPRLFRYTENLALVNRMGFNNSGAETVAGNISRRGRPQIPLGINIGKNTDCPLEKAAENYAGAFRLLHSLGDFFTINVSCPNVKNLRDLHEPAYLEEIFSAMKKINSQKPLFLKIAPDLGGEDLAAAIKVCLKYGAGIIACNTLPAEKAAYSQKGGLSGRPLASLAMARLMEIREISADIPVISSGGIFTGEDFYSRLDNGANLAEIYTSMIYEGPFSVMNILGRKSI